MLKYLSLSLFLLPVSYALGQKVTINWGPESKTELTYYSFVRGQGSDMIKLCFEENRKSILPVITGYNNNLQEQATNSITVNEDGIKFDQFLSLQNNLFFFTNKYDKKAKTTSFFCQPLNIKTFKPEGSNMDLGTFDAVKKSEQSTVDYSISKDSSKVLMMGLSPYSKNEAEKYYLAVYDNKMTKLWSNTVELPYKDKYVDILSNIVTNDGQVGIVLKHYENETLKEDVRKNGKKAPSYTTKLLLYSKGDSKPHEFKIDIGDKFVHTLSLADEDGKDLVLFGLYQLKAEGNVNGYFLAKVNSSTKKVTLNNLNAFPEALLSLVKKDKQGSDKEKDPGLGDNFKFVRAVSRNNGDKDYLLEFRYSRLITVRTQYSSYSYWLHTFGDIIDINVKPDGKHVLARIPKYQQAMDDSKFLSFKALPYKDKLLFFYNDDNKNLQRDLSEKPEEIKFGKENATFAMATIDADGNVSRSVLINSKETKFTTAVNVSFRVAENKIALYASKGGRFSKSKDMIGLLEVN